MRDGMAEHPKANWRPRFFHGSFLEIGKVVIFLHNVASYSLKEQLSLLSAHEDEDAEPNRASARALRFRARHRGGGGEGGKARADPHPFSARAEWLPPHRPREIDL